MKGLRAAAPSSVRRVSSYINRLQPADRIRAAALVAGSRSLPRDVIVHHQPALEVDRLQHAMARREIDLPVPEVEDGVAVERVGLGAGYAFGVLVIGEHEPVF